jgi:hypothetical protein
MRIIFNRKRILQKNALMMIKTKLFKVAGIESWQGIGYRFFFLNFPNFFFLTFAVVLCYQGV